MENKNTTNKTVNTDEKKLYLLKLGEISLKGLNRNQFEKALADNIKAKFRGIPTQIVRKKGRMFMTVSQDVEDVVVESRLSKVFGLYGFAKCFATEKDIQKIKDLALAVVGRKLDTKASLGFKIVAKREDKKFELSSYDICCQVADCILTKYPHFKVNLSNPDFVLHIEVRDKVYVYLNSQNTLAGLPVGTAGKALSLLSGGIDSPVSSVKMASRGLREELVYFHAYPFTGNEALDKVKALAKLIAPYLGGTILHIVNFTPVEMRIKDTVQEREKTLMLRACMMRVACLLAKRRRCSAIITGEALSQVASQTLAAMNFTTSIADMLVLRPLVGMDKEEIIRYARQIGTYETSILPFADCCSLFSPKHPITNPDIEQEHKSYEKMDISELEEEAARTAQVVCYNPNGEEYEP